MLKTMTIATCCVVSFATLAAADPLDAVRSGQVLLRRGSRGPTVAALQQALTQEGYPLSADGIFGIRTEAAVRAFQGSRGLSVDGVVGPATAGALGSGNTSTQPQPQPQPQPAPNPGTVGSTPGVTIPARPSSARAGSAVLASTNGMSLSQRGAVFEREILAGNVPNFERSFVTLTLRSGGSTLELKVCPDWLAVGHDRDFIRVPLDPRSAQRIADRFGCVLPTRPLVNAIWQQAALKLRPVTLTPGSQMQSNEWLRRNEAGNEAQRRVSPLGLLVSGLKKDVVLTNRLNSRPSKVAIYGWHRQSGSPWQPLSTVHGWSYVDYSHGIRLIARRAKLDGNPVDVDQLYARGDSRVSDEGPLSWRRYR
ncbi:MAG TPA: hypothetical protein DEA08_34485 [Planctomycetes bacterium]|nr:hypothetical protein [Planctomycetota bacterium]